MGIRPIGEQVRRLRNSCTGPAPVHFFVKAAGVAVLLAAAPLSSAHAAAAPAPTAQNPSGQSVDDFYRARNGAPLWLAPSAGDAAEQLLTLLGTASLDRLEPDKYHAGPPHVVVGPRQLGVGERAEPLPVAQFAPPGPRLEVRQQRPARRHRGNERIAVLQQPQPQDHRQPKK